jgi:hypothetical protein
VASVLVIEELTGRKRRLTLKGGGLPFQGATWGGEATVSTQWNPGNPEATQQVLGAAEMPSSWEGEWNTNRLLEAPSTHREGSGVEQEVVFPDKLSDLMDSIRKGCQLLRVTWQEHRVVQSATARGQSVDRQWRVVRVGRLTEFSFSPERMDDVAWSATFDWMGRGEARRAQLDLRGDSRVSASRRAIAAQNAAVTAIESARIRKRDGVANAVGHYRIGDLEAFADGPRQLVADFAQSARALTDRMRELGDLVIKVRETPAAIAGQAIDVATNAVAVANQFVDQMSREGPEAMSLQNSVSSLTRAASYYGEAQTQAELMAAAAERFARTVRRRRHPQLGSAAHASRSGESEVLAVHVVREGDTMFSISQRYYGDDLSAELCRANGLPEYTIEPPTRVPIVVPTRTTLDSQQARGV